MLWKLQAELSRQQEELAQRFMRDGDVDAGLQMLVLEDVLEASMHALSTSSLLPQVCDERSFKDGQSRSLISACCAVKSSAETARDPFCWSMPELL